MWGWVIVMSLWPREDRGIAEAACRLVWAVMPKGCFAMRWRDVLGVLFEGESFAGLFAGRGRPAQSPGRFVVISVL